MSIIKELKESLKEIVKESGYEEDDLAFSLSQRKDLGDYQLNDALKLASKYHENPIQIAEKIAKKKKKDARFINVNIAGPGFINFSLSDEFLCKSMNLIIENKENNIDKEEEKKIFMDYGGANIAKTLHVGHLRSANIGEAGKRLSRALGYNVISDVHFGDIGRQSGMVISEIKEEHPNLPYFDENYKGDYNDIDFEITEDDLGRIYPLANTKAKEDPKKMEEVIEITRKLEEGHKGYNALWNKIKEVSIKDIKGVYKKIGTTFDLYEGESDCYPYIPEMINEMRKKGYLRKSEDAEVIDVKEDTDKEPMPPLVVVKSNGGALYATRDLATIKSRMERFNPDEIWYFADNRQSLYFEQVFRAARKTGLVNKETKLGFYGFGTMNGEDGKPFKTRDGGVMSLKELIKIVTDEEEKKVNEDIVGKENKTKVAEMVGISSLKYADLIPYRETDYIFSKDKFLSLDGKTAPYLLYSVVRIKSLLKKADEKCYMVTKLKGTEDRKLMLTLLNLPTVLTNSLKIKSLNELSDYIYELTSAYNSFYNSNKILTEKDEKLKSSWIALSKLVYDTNIYILNILGLEVPEKM